MQKLLYAGRHVCACVKIILSLLFKTFFHVQSQTSTILYLLTCKKTMRRQTFWYNLPLGYLYSRYIVCNETLQRHIAFQWFHTQKYLNECQCPPAFFSSCPVRVTRKYLAGIDLVAAFTFLSMSRWIAQAKKSLFPEALPWTIHKQSSKRRSLLTHVYNYSHPSIPALHRMI